MRKQSTDYSSRRSGGQEENQRRSGDYGSPTPRRASQGGYAPESPLSSQSASSYSPRASTPRIERKRSTDYPSRRAGGQEENQRRSRDYTSPGNQGVHLSGRWLVRQVGVPMEPDPKHRETKFVL